MKVLFVDDEREVLEALDRALDLLAGTDWELRFVDSGAAALVELATGDFDAVVTDLQMPGIDGATLLDRVAEIAPRAARIVLSGAMASDGVVRATRQAHQVLGKPCKAEVLCNLLRSSTRLRALLDEDGLRQAIIAIDRLPAVPTSYREIEAELWRPSASPMTLAAIVARDPGLRARTLQVANSPYFGGGGRIDDMRQVIARLGVQTISALALAAVFDPQESRAHELDLRALADRSMRTAAIAGQLAGHDRAHAYLAGMMTEVGRIVLSIAKPAEYDLAVQRARIELIDVVTAERDLCGAAHPEVGAYLLAVWGLPDGVVDAVASHHTDVRTLLDREAPRLVVCTAVAAMSAAGLAVDPELLRRAGLPSAMPD